MQFDARLLASEAWNHVQVAVEDDLTGRRAIGQIQIDPLTL